MLIDFSPSSKPFFASADFATNAVPSTVPERGDAATGPVLSAGSSSDEQPTTSVAKRASESVESASFMMKNLREKATHGRAPLTEYSLGSLCCGWREGQRKRVRPERHDRLEHRRRRIEHLRR